jgi:chorismate dehydratase
MKNLKKDRIRVSAVSYLNTLPFIYGLTHSHIRHEINLTKDNPSVCAQKLIDEEADVGLVPVASIPHISGANIISNYCIGADGPVKTVILFSNFPLNQVKTIYLDTESRTSVKLVQVLAKKFWNKSFEWKQLGDLKDDLTALTAFVMIGDKTFAQKANFKYNIDLAEEWKKFTGLPFVFAVWVANKALSQRFINDFDEAMMFGVNNIDDAVEQTGTGLISKTELKDYLMHSISYSLDDAKKSAMQMFLENFK